jgi:AcrR family transcriptional regulator
LAVTKRNRIAEAAVRCFLRRGFAATRILEIAAEAQVGKGTVYEYFRSKEEILAAACLNCCVTNERLVSAAYGMSGGFEVVMPTGEHPVAFIHRALADGLGIVLGRGPGEQRLFSELLLLRGRDSAVAESASRELRVKYQTWTGLAKGWFAQGVAAGFLRSDLAGADVAELILAVFDGLVWQSCWLEPDPPATVGRRFADLVCRILLREPARLEEYLS